MKTIIRTAGRLGVGVALTIGSTLLGRSQESKFYVHFDAGGTIPRDPELVEFFGPVAPGSKVSLDPGIRVGFSGGYQFTDWFASEIEVAGMGNAIHSITGASVHDASLSNVPLMFNLKLQLPNRTRLVPYIGAGAGVSFSIIDADYIIVNTPLGQTSFSGTDSDAVFAWQGIAGVRFDLNAQMGISVEYRYFWADAPTWGFDYYYGFFPPQGDSLKFGHSQLHVISLAFDFRF